MAQNEDNPHAQAQGDVTVVLGAISRGEKGAAEKLLPLVYEELRRIARARVAQESPGITLQPTALVHEAYLRLLGNSNVQFDNHAHFFGAAAIAMRRILIERARRKRPTQQSVGQHQAANASSSPDLEDSTNPDSVDLLGLDRALDRLSQEPGRLTEVVHLRFFAGLTVEQTAAVMGVSPRTIKRDWNFAKAWLRDEMSRTSRASIGEN